MIIPEINLAEYHQKVETAIAAKFSGDLEGVFSYPIFEDKIPKSISIELDAIFPGDPPDTGTDQLHAELRFAAYVVVPFTEENPKRLVRQLATRLSGFVRGQRFGCPGAGAARFISANSDDFSLPGKSGRAGMTEEYEVWRVEWAFEAYVGESIWNTAPPPVPTEIEINGEGVNP
jgi:hypothetical protein